MNAFSRAYRDPKSPLTPLTPLAANTAFTFNLSGDETLKPIMQAIQIERAKNNSTISPAGMISSIKCPNPSKYINDQTSNINTKNTSTEAAVKIKKLSPRFVSTKIPKVKCTSYDNQSSNSTSNRITESNITKKLSPNYAYKNKSLKVPRDSLSSNSSSYEETSDSSSSYNTNSSGWTSCSSARNSSRQSSASKTSFTANSSASSTSGISQKSTKRTERSRHIPPKLNIDTSEDNNGTSMSSVLSWVWNQLSPLSNPTIYELLTRVGMQKYWDIFKREEIVDLDVFSTLTLADLETIGIKNSNDCLKILECVRMALDFLSGLFNFKKP